MLENTYENTVYLTERLIALALLFQSIEYFQIRKTFGAAGVWSWRVLNKEFQIFWYPLRIFFDLVLSDRSFPILIFLRLLATGAALIFPFPILWAFVLLSTVLIAMRWRGTFNGGSDYMTVIILTSVFFCRLWNEVSPIWMILALGYLGLQVCLSYFVAGIAKLRRAKWRNGDAVYGFLTSRYYGAPAVIRNREFQSQVPFQIAGWIILTFECLFPIALINPRICLVMMALAFIFHVLNASIYGLNRFVWTWLAAYPALYWCSTYIDRLAL